MTVSAKGLLKDKTSLGWLPEPYVIVEGSSDEIATAINMIASKGYRVVTAYGGGYTGGHGSGKHFVVMEKYPFEVPKPIERLKGVHRGSVLFPQD